ncbi:hypothetical protein Tco_0135453, partial [Tanacetum coccineum]
LQTQPVEALTTVTPVPLTVLTVCPEVLTQFTLTVLTFSFEILVFGAVDFQKDLLIVDAAALKELCLAALTGTLPDLVKTADGTTLF